VSHSSHLGLLAPVLGYGLGQIGVIIVFTLSGLVMAFLYLDICAGSPGHPGSE